MELVFSNSALKKKWVLNKTGNGCGFLIGSVTGSTLIIDDFFNHTLNRENLEQLYPPMLQKYGNSFLGVYFSDEHFDFSEWMLGSYVLHLGRDQLTLYFCEFDKEKGFKKEEIWRG